MKKIILSLVTLTIVTMSFAQNTLVATLSHGEDITMYYGTYALRDAMNAAQSGDVVNLSGGGFQAVNITKAVTLRGTGIDDAAPTYINGNFTINIPSEDANRLTMEGIRCTGEIKMEGTFSNPYFVKSQFYRFYYANANIENAMFTNCKITYNYELKGASSVQFINSYVNEFNNNGQNNSVATFVNCIIRPWSNGYYASYICNSQLLNCIIFQTGANWTHGNGTSNMLPTTTIATNCVGIGYGYLFNQQVANKGNWAVSWNEFAKVFKDFGTLDTSKDIRVAAGPVIPAGKAKVLHEAAFDWMATKLESWGLPTER